MEVYNEAMFWILLVAVVSFGGRQVSADIAQVLPESCQNMVVCEDVPNYPAKQVEEKMPEVADKVAKFTTVDLRPLKNTTRRLGDVTVPICPFSTKLINPKAARDTYGKWWFLLQVPNQNQKWMTDICEPGVEGRPCNPIITPNEGYKGSCQQKYVLASALTFDENVENINYRFIKLPVDCQCMFTKTDE